MTKKYIVTLTEAERESLCRLTSRGKSPARKITRAHVLLKADENGPNWTDKQIHEAFNVTVRTIEHIRKQFVEQGLQAALNRRRPSSSRRPRLDGHQEAQLVALACSDPPEGRSCWTLRLLGSKMVELNYVETVSHETVRQVLKKTRSSPG